jgi:hypothetical protein
MSGDPKITILGKPVGPVVKHIWGDDYFFFDGWGDKSVHFPNVGPYKKMGTIWVDDAGVHVIFRCNACDQKTIIPGPGDFTCPCGGAK